ncbi:MAG: hypothetical protein WCQ41_06145 [Bacillota bacterium]
MNNFLRQQKGEISIYILLVLLVGCVIVPVYAIFLEKGFARNNFDKIQDTITVSVTSAYQALMPEYYTDAEIKLNEEVFLDKFNKLLMVNLSDEFPGIEIMDEKIFSEPLPEACENGKTFKRPGIHIVVSVPVVFSALSLLLPVRAEEFKRVNVHGDVQFTVGE